MADIFFWSRQDKYGYLSNFYRSPIEVDGKVYATTEHYYQASKTLISQEQEMIRGLVTPTEAKFAGYHVTLRKGWNGMKDEVMLRALMAKFTQYPPLKEELLSTGDTTLHENSPWDRYWGYVDGRGLDTLGKLLMQVRGELSNV